MEYLCLFNFWTEHKIIIFFLYILNLSYIHDCLKIYK